MTKIEFSNKTLENSILYELEKQNIYVDYISYNNALKIKKLNLTYIEVVDYSFLKNFINLKELIIKKMDIVDLSFLEDLVKLKSLNLENNNINDISILGKLSKLEVINLKGNRIENIEVLSKFKKLKELNLEDNNIKSYTFLKNIEIEKFSFNKKEIDEEMYNIISSFKNFEGICARESKVEVQFKLDSKYKYIDFFKTEVDKVDFSELKVVNLLDVRGSGLKIEEFKHLEKIGILGVDELKEEEIFLLENFVYEKELQFINIENLEMEVYEQIRDIENLKIITNNNEVNRDMLFNNKLHIYTRSSLNFKVMYKYFIDEYLKNILLYIDENMEKTFNPHLLFLKKLYISLYLPYNEECESYIPFYVIEDYYITYITNEEWWMSSYERAKFKEFYALFCNNKKFDTDEERQEVVIDILKESLAEKEDEFVYYKIIYYYLLNNEYELAFEYYKEVRNNNYNYNYYVAYYELILMDYFEAEDEEIFSALGEMLDSFDIRIPGMFQLLYNYVLLDQMNNIHNEVVLTQEGYAPLFNKDIIKKIIRNKVVTEFAQTMSEEKAYEYYLNFIKKEEISNIIKQYDQKMDSVVEGKKQVRDIVSYDHIDMGRWEREAPFYSNL